MDMLSCLCFCATLHIFGFTSLFPCVESSYSWGNTGYHLPSLYWWGYPTLTVTVEVLPPVYKDNFPEFVL